MGSKVTAMPSDCTTRRRGGGEEEAIEMADTTTTGPPRQALEFKEVLAKTFKDLLVW